MTAEEPMVNVRPHHRVVLYTIAAPSTVALIFFSLIRGNAFLATLGGILFSALAAYYIRVSRSERRQ